MLLYPHTHFSILRQQRLAQSDMYGSVVNLWLNALYSVSQVNISLSRNLSAQSALTSARLLDLARLYKQAPNPGADYGAQTPKSCGRRFSTQPGGERSQGEMNVMCEKLGNDLRILELAGECGVNSWELFEANDLMRTLFDTEPLSLTS